MDLKGVHNFFAELEKKLGELGVESTYVDGAGGPQTGDTLRVLFPVTEEGHAAITELMVTSFAEDLDLLIIYSTVVAELNEKAGELPQKLIEWNLDCPLGAFGVYREENQLYHKYSVPFDRDKAPGDLAEEAMTLLSVLFEVLSAHYPTYSAYASET